MLRHKTTHAQCKIWSIRKIGWSNGPEFRRPPNSRAILAVTILPCSRDKRDLRCVARGRTETFTKGKDSWSQKRQGGQHKRRYDAFHELNLLGAHSAYCSNSESQTGGPQGALQQTPQPQTPHTWMACLPHQWIFTVGQRLLERRKSPVSGKYGW